MVTDFLLRDFPKGKFLFRLLNWWCSRKKKKISPSRRMANFSNVLRVVASSNPVRDKIAFLLLFQIFTKKYLTNNAVIFR
jgi:hypothetical protein